MLHFHFQDIKKIKLKQAIIKQWLKSVAAKEKFNIGEINYIFCSDEYLLSINQQYLKHNTYTDIITFDYSNKEENIISGDIFISLERVKENAEKFKVSFEKELFRVLVHGILHLMGYKDKTSKDAKLMRAKEYEALEFSPNSF